jgi:hypothetical protein
VLPRIDFAGMRLTAAHFVQSDYSHLTSDLVLEAPLLPVGKGKRRRLTIYILIEHQSEPDRFMVFRVLEYVVQIYKRQMQAWEKEHGSSEDFEFQPVLPIVLYSGTRTWERLESLRELIAQVEELSEVLPEFLPLFLNISKTPGEELEERGGAFGLLLRLVQQRKLRRSVFEETLSRVVRSLEKQMADDDRKRWLDLLSYVHALIYHERDEPEREELSLRVADSLDNDAHRKEVYDMGRTIAEALQEEGIRKGELSFARRTLLSQLQLKFKKVPADIVQRIEITDSVEQLTDWLNALIKAKKLADVGIPPVE